MDAIERMQDHPRRMATIQDGWQERVYRVSVHKESGLEYAEWRLLRDAVLRRDHFTCQRCNQKFRAKKDLSIHHLKPRSEGGHNEKANLVTLCHTCHDYVEVHDLKTLSEIIGSYEDISVVTYKAGEIDDDEPDPYNRPEWHKYVYGGQKRKKG